SEWPRSDLADEALFNAAIDFHKAGRPEQGIEVRERLAREYPKSDLAPEALYRNAVALEEMANFAAAAAAYEDYAAKWDRYAGRKDRRGRRQRAKDPGPKYEEDKARAALFNAGIFREA